MAEQNKLAFQELLLAGFLSLAVSQNSFSAISEEDRAEEVKLKSSVWMLKDKKADELIAAGKLAEAEAIYKQILGERQTLQLDLATERSALARIYEKMHRPADAINQWETLIKEREKQAGAEEDVTVAYVITQYADYLDRSGKKEQAHKLKEKAKRIQLESSSTASDIQAVKKLLASPGSPAEKSEKLRKLGEAFLQKSDGQKAMVYLHKAVELNPKNIEALCDRGETYYFNNDDKSAMSDYRKAISLDAKFARAYFDAGNLLRGENNFAKAIAEYNKAIEFAPTNIDYLGARGKLLDVMGKHKEAVADYSKVLELRPSCIWARVQRATAYEGLKDFDKAAADLTALIERYPGDQDYYEYRAKTYANAGKNEKAATDYGKVVELAPKYAGGYLGRARAYEKLEGKNSAKAKADYAQARKFGYSP